MTESTAFGKQCLIEQLTREHLDPAPAYSVAQPRKARLIEHSSGSQSIIPTGDSFFASRHTIRAWSVQPNLARQRSLPPSVANADESISHCLPIANSIGLSQRSSPLGDRDVRSGRATYLTTSSSTRRLSKRAHIKSLVKKSLQGRSLPSVGHQFSLTVTDKSSTPAVMVILSADSYMGDIY